ncbi:uncharacterized protein CBL_20945 [Carabus blaptoides fortunei]
MKIDSDCPVSNDQEVNKTDDAKDEDNSNIVESESTDKSESDVNNPYAYLKRDEFTSEKFKIEIRGLPKYYGISELRKLLNDKLKLATNKIKSPRKRSSWLYVCFRNDEDKLKAIDTITGFKWKGKILKASDAKPMPDPLVKKRKQNADKEECGKKAKFEGTQEERLKNSTIPYWNIVYEEQLKMKQEEIKKILTKMGNDLSHINPDLRKWIDENKKKYDGLPCELWNIRFANKTEGYRNKCEFTVGKNEENGLPTVGFRLGSYVTGFTGVGPVDSLKHIPDRMKVAVKVFEEFVRSSDLEVFNPEVQTGHFKQLTARMATTTDQLMLIVGINPQKLPDVKLQTLKTELITYFTEGNGKEANVTSLYYLPIVKRESGQSAPLAEHLYGETHIYETILDLKFRISPEAFFQVNTEAAEMLYSSAIELANPTLESTVVDICCGTGTIGLCFAQKCGQVLGLELVPQAIIDAKENATINHIGNCDFFAGRAEDILTSVLYRATMDDVIAIVDPPRAGMHNRAIAQLRKTKKLSKLVYISCDPAAACNNFVNLGRPESKTMHGNPLVPVRAVAVDLFPHTKHCELLIYFERWNQSKNVS